MEGMMTTAKKTTHIKENTDISGIEVKKLKTVKENVGLGEITTARAHFITSRMNKKHRRHRNAQVRVNRLVKDIEDEK